MKLEIRAPELSESVASGTLLTWRKQEGDNVQRDETLADIETDKVILEIPAPASGVLDRIAVAEGATVNAGELLAVLEVGDVDGVVSLEKTPMKQAAPPASTSTPPADQSEKIETASIELTTNVPEPSRSPPKSEVLPAKRMPDDGPHKQRLSVQSREGRETRTPMSRLRQRVAERLVAAQNTAAILTTFNEVNMQPVNELRQRFKAEFEVRHGIKLGYMSFFVRAVCDALRQFPVVNAAIDGEDIVYHDYYDIGIAVSTQRGLMVPILRDAQRLSFAEIEKGIADFAARAQTGAVSIDELTGGTFSITNGGVFGSLLSTPILNPPQSGILGMHKIQERPVAENGQVVIRPMMYLALSYDHRLIDGRDAVQFLVAVKAALEMPERLLLDV